MSNTFGTNFRLTTAGESHGKAMVGIIDGVPSGFKIDFDKIKETMNSRRGGAPGTTSRRESDEVIFLSGLLDGVTLGTPIAFIIPNTDVRSEDYEHLKKTFRPNHADFTYQTKYGIRDVRGGGRASARETAVRVAAGAIAEQILGRKGLRINAFTSQIGPIKLDEPFAELDLSKINRSPVFCPDEETSGAMVEELERVKQRGDTVSCVVSCIIEGLPAGIGEPIYDKLSARLAYAMLSINAAHGFEFGMGFKAGYGSEMRDDFIVRADGTIGTATNHSGGIQGGITNGMPVEFSVAFKPLPTLMRPTESINLKGEKVVIEPRGRHDVCAAPRAVAVVKAMTAITLMDLKA